MDDQLKGLPPEYASGLLPDIREEFIKSGKTVVVLDDDPTGTQTSYDITVLTAWNVPLLVAELKKKPSILFILTNSRSVNEAAAVQLMLEIGRNLKEAVKESGRQIAPVSRSDSTLRGHFPAEIAAMAQALDLEEAAWILLPAFIEGGRYTIGDVHYIREQEELVPVASTPFAKDAVFGYTHSNLKEWVEEKTKARIAASEVLSVSLDDIRLGGPEAVFEKLARCKARKVCVVNACSFRDLEVFVMGALMAERSGRKFIFRTSATFVTIRAGIAPGRIFEPKQEHSDSKRGSLTVVGSYVPKTTSQLDYLLALRMHEAIEVNVNTILKLPSTNAYAIDIIDQTNDLLGSGRDVVIYTSRKLEMGDDPGHSLKINSSVSSFLVNVVQGLKVRPAFMVSKGGITSSDLASKGLNVEKALILGQIIPGVPVWQLQEESKFPGLIYVVFPGNVGDRNALAEVTQKLKSV